MIFFRKILFLLFIVIPFMVNAQEYSLPLQENVVIKARAKEKGRTAQKPTLLTLPFFEDFTDYDPYPNPERWTNRYVYINNTMGRNIISRGVATFDALNEKGAVYYDTITAYTQIYADSLTSQVIDLSSHLPSDSIYLSFFYQPKGYGFSPKPYDSLMLYLLKSNGVWEKVWSVNGDTLQPFRQVMIPVKDTGYLNSNFQMRWINLATKGISDSHWNLDYIRLAANRTQADTVLNDIAFSKDPPSILNDFSAMPFRHFKTNTASFLASNLSISLRNNGTATPNTPTGYSAKVIGPGTNLGSGNTNISLTPNTEADALFPIYNAGSYSPPDPNGRIVYEHHFYCTSNYPNESKTNDTIVSNQIFDNYFAYDDGTAEQSYFLNLLPNAPGVTAVEYALYTTDTLRGIAIRFARSIPDQSLKEFSIGVYRSIAINGNQEDLLYQENFLYPTYEDTINKFSVYTFEQPLLLNTGSFFIGIIQPAGGTSDSLLIALDANRVGGNHRYYKVEDNWEPSLLDGALMLRPLLGATLPLAINDIHKPELNWRISPIPSRNSIKISIPEQNNKTVRYSITDIQGKTLLTGAAKNNHDIDIHVLSPGIYFIRIDSENGFGKPIKLLKL